eukprot:4196644-Prymnesium_polylepis.1
MSLSGVAETTGGGGEQWHAAREGAADQRSATLHNPLPHPATLQMPGLVVLAALESRLVYLLLLWGLVDAAPVRAHEGSVQTGFNMYQVTTVLLTVLLVIWMMESRGVAKKKATRGKKGAGGANAKK